MVNLPFARQFTTISVLALALSCESDEGLKVYHSAPAVSITSPADGAQFVSGNAISFEAIVSDDRDDPGELSLLWTSDRDGEFNSESASTDGSVRFSTGILSSGFHVITLKVINSQALDSEDEVTLTVADADQAPSITLRSPQADDLGVEGIESQFAALVSDPQDASAALVVSFSSSLLVDPFCTPLPDLDGYAECSAALAPGNHVLTMAVTDLDGNVATTTGEFLVVDADEFDDDEDGYTETEGDCDDADRSVHPDATEYPNGIDDDCDNEVDEGTFNVDDDLDGYSEAEDDCDDGDPTTFPGALEVCDGVDNDCDLTIDEGTSCFDDDNDGITESEGDCDDADDTISPLADELCDGIDNNCDTVTDEETATDTTDYFADTDGDGFGDPAVQLDACAAPSGYVANDLDCDDYDDAINPDADELCDAIDNDCDGVIDPTTSIDALLWYADADLDTYGDPANAIWACDAPTGYVDTATDCNDASNTENPGGTELCNGADDNCDGTIDESSATDATTWYLDADGDTFGTSGATIQSCELPTGYSAVATDCNDADATIRPTATESCNGTDDDCDGSTDEGVTSTFFRDADTDGYGDAGTFTTGCSAPTGYVSDSTDCDDTNAALNPATIWFRDSDADSYGAAASTRVQCAQPSGYVADDTDCNDAAASAYPGATERCDGIDNNCTGIADESTAVDAITWYLDADGDGYGTASSTTPACSKPAGYSGVGTDCNDAAASISPIATETCNSIDDDCDSATDEGVTTTYYEDYDSDGYGDPSSPYAGCSLPAGYVANSSDCDDADDTTNPDTIWYRDSDADTFGDPYATLAQCEKPSGYVADDSDCNDSTDLASPIEVESCDGIDNDCDGTEDEQNASDCDDYYLDDDGDDYGKEGTSARCYCEPTGDYTASNNDDCYDSNANANPAATAYYTTSRGDGSYDYNCDGSNTKRYTSNYTCTGALYVCIDSTAGWGTSSDPACGASGNWRSGCDADLTSCSYSSTSSRTQSCR